MNTSYLLLRTRSCNMTIIIKCSPISVGKRTTPSSTKAGMDLANYSPLILRLLAICVVLVSTRCRYGELGYYRFLEKPVKVHMAYSRTLTFPSRYSAVSIRKLCSSQYRFSFSWTSPATLLLLDRYAKVSSSPHCQ